MMVHYAAPPPVPAPSVKFVSPRPRVARRLFSVAAVAVSIGAPGNTSLDHHCLARAVINVKVNILHAQRRAWTRTLKMNFSLDAVHEQGTPRA